MHWKRLDRDSPYDGMTCIVGHFLEGDDKPVIGIWEYCSFGKDSYWQTKDGSKIQCSKYDNWCNVDDVIDAVADKIKENFSWEIEKAKMRCMPLW